MPTQEVDIVNITDEQAHETKVLAANLSTPQIRKRGMLDYLGISCAQRYLLNKKIKTSTIKSVHKIPFLFEEFKISDIYYGNYRIDVITLYKEKTIKIPKIHVDMEILPHYYFIVQIGAKIQEAKMIGFINGKSILNCSHDSKFYYPTLDMIIDVEKFYSLTKRSVASKTLLGKHIDCMGLFLKFIDNDLSSVYKSQLIQHLMNCDSCRARFIDVTEFEKLADSIKYYPNLLRKYDSDKQVSSIIARSALNNSKTLEERINDSDILENRDDNSLRETTIIDKTTQAKGVDIIYPKENSQLKTVQMFDIGIKENKKKGVIKAIDTMFNDIPKFELPAIKTIMQTKNKRLLLIIIVIFFVLSSFVLISFNNSNDMSDIDKQVAQYNENNDDSDVYEQEFYGDDDYSLSNSINNATKEASIDDFTIKQPALNKPTYSPTITKVAWEAPQSLAQQDIYTKYLQSTGKNIKLNLQNDLLLINDVPVNKGAKVQVTIDKYGNTKNIDFILSSGSNDVDKVIKRIIIDTLKSMKIPTQGLDEKGTVLILVVNLL